MLWGWGTKHKTWYLGNGYTLLCVYKYFHLYFLLRFVTSKKWYIQGHNTYKQVSKQELEELFGGKLPIVNAYFTTAIPTQEVIAINHDMDEDVQDENEQFDDEVKTEAETTTSSDGSSELPIVSFVKFLGKKFGEGWETPLYGEETPLSKQPSHSNRIEKPRLKNAASKNYKTESNTRWIALVIVGLIVLVAVAHRPVDNYITIHTANSTMVNLAQNAGMSTEGEVLFLKTKPQLDTDSQMEADCSSNAAANNSNGFIEQGCYVPTTNRIYIRKMPSNLYNLEVATAAYEMLHPVYISLTNSGDGKALNASIENNYHAINDANLNQQVANFNKTEPGDIDLELFSLLGTGYSSLTSDLNNYYSPYFSDISKTVAANNQVYQLFQSDVSQLNSLNDTYNQYKNLANTANSDANSAYQYSVDAANNGNAYYDNYNYNIYKQDIAAYNSDVDTINNNANQYNSLLNDYNNLITEFNGTQPVAQLQTDQSQNPQSQ